MIGLLKEITSRFPTEHLVASFAYGSGVFKQIGNKGSMIDLVLVTSDSVAWHTANMLKNGRDYSLIRRFGSKFVANVQDNHGAFILFNPYVRLSTGHLIKYGVISDARLLSDLLDWDTLYVSGRLHKPVMWTKEYPREFALPIMNNLLSAVHCALLLLPERFSKVQLYKTISQLSYTGDVRWLLGAENVNKVDNLVRPMLDLFDSYYSDAVMAQQGYLFSDGDHLEQTLDSNSRLFHLTQLPKTLTCEIIRRRNGSMLDAEEVLLGVSRHWDCAQIVRDSAAAIVRRRSWSQALKGLLTAGVVKSINYSTAKLSKSFLSRKM